MTNSLIPVRAKVKPSPGVEWSERLSDLTSKVNAVPEQVTPNEWKTWRQLIAAEDPAAFALRNEESSLRRGISAARNLPLETLRLIVQEKEAAEEGGENGGTTT